MLIAILASHAPSQGFSRHMIPGTKEKNILKKEGKLFFVSRRRGFTMTDSDPNGMSVEFVEGGRALKVQLAGEVPLVFDWVHRSSLKFDDKLSAS